MLTRSAPRIAAAAVTSAAITIAAPAAAAPAAEPYDRLAAAVKASGGEIHRNEPSGVEVSVDFSSFDQPRPGRDLRAVLLAVRDLGTRPGLTIRLGLSGADVTDDTLGLLDGTDGLGELELGPASVTDDGPARLKGLKNLRRLTLTSDRITGAGFRALQGSDALCELSLYETALTEGGLAAIGGSKGFGRSPWTTAALPTPGSDTSPGSVDLIR